MSTKTRVIPTFVKDTTASYTAIETSLTERIRMPALGTPPATKAAPRSPLELLVATHFCLLRCPQVAVKAWFLVPLMWVSVGLASVPLHFPGQITVTVGAPATAVATYDIDGEGMAEVITGRADGLLAVIESIGNGNFRATRYQQVGGEIVALKVFTPGPGPGDVLVALTANPDRLLVLNFQDEDPPFSIQAIVELEEDPRGLAGGPVAAGGAFGLVVTLPGSDRWVLVSHATGSWVITQEVLSGDRPYDVALLDLTGDGVPEVVTTDNGVLSRKLSLFAQGGNGTYAMIDQIDAPGHLVGLHTFSADGTDQLFACYSDSSFLSIFTPLAETLTESSRVSVASPVDGVAARLLGGGDRALWCWNASRGIVHYYEMPVSTWQPIESYYAGGPAVAAAITDINRDSFFDIAIANGNAESAALLFANDQPSYRAYLATLVLPSPNDGLVMDEDGDGHLDYVTVSLGRSAVEFLRGDGSGHLVKDPQILPQNSPPRTLTTINADGDGLRDLAVVSSNNNQVYIWLRQADGTYQSASTVTSGNGPFRALAADFDRDGFEDLVIGNEISDDITLAFGAGDGTFPDVSVMPLPNDLTEINYVHLDPDPLPDLLLTNGQGSIATMLNLGNRVFGQVRFYAIGLGAIAIEVADLDNDGDEDVVVAKEIDGSLAILENLNNGNLRLRQRDHDLAGSPAQMIILDIDLTGTQDVIVTYPSDNSIGIVLSGGNFLFGPPIKYVSALQPVNLAAGDFNEDDVPDLVLLDRVLQIAMTMLNVEPNPIPIHSAALAATCRREGVELTICPPGSDPWVLEGEQGDTWVTVADAGGSLYGILVWSGDSWSLVLSDAEIAQAGLDPGTDARLGFRLIDSAGNTHAVVTVDIACLSITWPASLLAVGLDDPHPNPFNPAVTAQFTLTAPAWVRAEVWNLAGQLVAVLADRHYAAGRYPVHWDGREQGRAAAAGTYLLTVTADEVTVGRKMTLLK